MAQQRNVTRYSAAPEPVRWWIGLAVVALVAAFSPVPPWLVDRVYSREMYPWLQTALTTATNLLPIALLDVVIVVAVALGLMRIGRLWLTAVHRSFIDAAWELTRRLIRVAAVLTIMFLWTWGCHYRRLPLESALVGSQAVSPTVAMLRNAVADANGLAVRLRPTVALASPSYDELAAVLHEPMNRALEALNRPRLRTPARPKFSLLLTPYFTAAGINGMIHPFALETIVHPDLLPFERAFVLAHEWGHLAGQADEAEASAVGWLACMYASPAAAYSASLFLITESVAALPADDRRTAMARVDPGVQADLAAIAERMTRQRPVIRQTAERAYDEFLKANRVSDGTASYGRALQLILTSPIYDAMGSVRLNRRTPRP